MKYKVLFLLLSWVPCFSKVLIVSHHFNRPEFIDIHLKTFKAFLEDDFEYVVFNDAAQEDMRIAIEQACVNNGIRCFRVPQHLHMVPGRTSPGHRHMDGIQHALNTVGYEHDGIVALIDSDMFLIKAFSIERYLKNHDIAGERQGRKNDRIEIRYLSPAIAFMNMQTLPNKKTLSFEGGYVEGLACDVGAHTYYYLKNNPTVRPSYINVIHIGAWKMVDVRCNVCSNMTCTNCIKQLHDKNFNDDVITFIQDCPDDVEFFLDHHFLHYRSGTNWNNKPAEYHIAKTNALNALLSKVLIN